jgi:hypothetical protein
VRLLVYHRRLVEARLSGGGADVQPSSRKRDGRASGPDPQRPSGDRQILLLKFALAGRSCRTLEGTVNWLALPGAVHVNPAPAALEDDDRLTEYPVIWTVPLELAPLHVTWTR